MGIEYIEIQNGGLLGIINPNHSSGRSVLLRADVDALPLKESQHNLLKRRVCISENDGIMHACGHDGHMAMLLGAGKILKEIESELNGTVYLCFERGEEKLLNHKYLLAYMDKNHINPDSVWAIHIKNDIESGTFSIMDGAQMAAAIIFDMTIKGIGGHGSRPDLANNPIDAFVAIYHSLQELKIRSIDPFDILSYSVGLIEGAEALNVIPKDLRFAGTARFLNREKAGSVFYKKLHEEINYISKAYDVEISENQFDKPQFPVINDSKCVELSNKIIKEEFGVEKIIQTEPWMASESFSAYLAQWPGVFAFLGTKNSSLGTGADHHNPEFDIDEDILPIGVTATVKYAYEFLNSDLVPEQREYKGKFKEYLKEIGCSEHEIEEFYR